MRHERVGIIGTAQSWALTPWQDTELYLMSLNDAYRLQGFQRADAWFDFHPMDKFFFPPDGQAQIFQHQIPPGHYARPVGHREWLGRQAQTIPVYLHPDYQTQCPEAAGWPHARAFPKADVEAHFGRYFTSSPAWMMALAIMQGAKEIHVYGIHLATEFEYVKQRPNFEFLCGRVLGPTRVTVHVKDGLRRYETADGVIVLPEASPILSSDFQYAFEPRPDAGLEPMKWDLHKQAVKQQRVVNALINRPWWKRKKPLQTELALIQARTLDVQDQMNRVGLAAQWS